MELQFDIENYSDFKRSMYIKASAGTGKTYTITKIIQKLIDAEVDLEKILVVTYTEKAAGELRDRIRKACPNKDVDNAPIFTIHSFCQKTLSEFSFTANQCANLSLIADTAVEDFIDHWIRDVLKNDSEFIRLYENSSKENSFINNLKRDFKQALSMYYLDKEGKEDKSIVSLEPVNFFNFKLDPKKIFNQITEQVLSCDDFEKIINLSSIEDLFFIDGFEAAWANLENNIHATKAEEFRDDILYNISTFNEFSFDGNSFQNRKMGNEVKDAFDYLKSIKDSWAKAEEKADKLLSHIFYNSQLQKLYLAWQNEKEKNKSQSYDDMLRSVREAVCEKNSALKKQLQKKYTYAIIDEFQDTNQKQWDIFKNIFMEDKDHTIIVVGDPKQSIYAFQGADVNVYTKAINSIAANGGAAYSLQKNYRSTDAMVKACNCLFSRYFFTPNSKITFNNSDTSGSKNPAKYNTEEYKPFWIAGNPKENKTVTEKDFAKITVQTIVDCCSFENGKTNLQVSDKDSEDGLRNVSFHDFAILARSSSELKETEKALKKAGIPFLRYKDANLFSGKECLYWISLINAITAKDFTSTNRNILNEALNSDFFRIPLNDVNDEKFDNPSCPERQLIIQWQQLAQKRKWAKLFEKIFADTDIENRLSRLDQMQSLTKIRQIGNYALDYLYKNDCSLEDVSRHLLRLSTDSESSMDEGDIVEKGTDFDCVQLMTIHASKGLEFPVVIVPAGLRARNNNVAQAFLYHDEYNNSKLSFSPYGKDKSEVEDDYERERIFYVAYTRASSLLILPFYDVWVPVKDKKGNYKETDTTKMYNFLNMSITSMFYNTEGDEYCKEIKVKNISDKDLQKAVQALLEENKKLKEKENGARLKEESSEVDQLQATKELSKKTPSLSTYKHCYSNLFHKKADDNEMTENGGRADKEDSGDQKNSLAEFDRADNPVSYIAVPGSQATCPPAVEAPFNYPSGTRLGKAIHEVFEKADFGTGKTDKGLEGLIRACFEKQTLSIPAKGSDMDSDGWLEYTRTLIWNTVNARLPEISGSAQTGNYFSLSELSAEDKISEAEFNMKIGSQESPLLKNYCNGFVDLIFKRTINGKNLYSVLDWKSDTLEPDHYSDDTELKKRTDDHYSIQRVLYSYSLIKWLSSFYKDKSEEEIFENHFGGIYYVYVRGCHPGTCSGIYARTWKSWAELESAFKNIFKKMHIAA